MMPNIEQKLDLNILVTSTEVDVASAVILKTRFPSTEIKYTTQIKLNTPPAKGVPKSPAVKRRIRKRKITSTN